MRKDREYYCTSPSSRLDGPELADQSIQRNIVAHIMFECGNFAKRYHLMEGMNTQKSTRKYPDKVHVFIQNCKRHFLSKARRGRTVGSSSGQAAPMRTRGMMQTQEMDLKLSVEMRGREIVT
jgi:hypothetical protein